MGKKLDLTALTEDEADHILQVVQRDFDLRKKEQERLSELKQKLNEEGNKRSILSKQERFNENCCIRCCRAFTFLINAKRPCSDCKFNFCKNCGAYSKKERVWICAVCHQARLLRTQSLEWYYSNVKGKFKYFGSAKVVHTLYKGRLSGRGSQPHTLASNVLDGSRENEDRICSSRCPSYKQTDGHTLSETLAAALRVAEEAIDEAITKAESYSDSLEKQNESQYLQEHKEELIEELASTIMQKVLKRTKSGGGLTDSESEQTQSQQSTSTKEPTPSFPKNYQQMSTLWRSQSEFSLTNEDAATSQRAESGLKSSMAISDQGRGCASPDLNIFPHSLPMWKSMELLDNAGSSAMMHNPDGNWMAVSCRPARPPRLLAKPKSWLFTALEQATGVISAYDEMGTDGESDDDLVRNQFGTAAGAAHPLVPQPDPVPMHLSLPSPEPARPNSAPPTACPMGAFTWIQDDGATIGARGTQFRGQGALGPHPPGQLDINYNQDPDSSDEDLPNHSERKHRRGKRSKCSSQQQLHETEEPVRSQWSTCQVSAESCRLPAASSEDEAELNRCMFVMEESLAQLERRISLGAWNQEESSIPVDEDLPAEVKSAREAESGTSLSKTHADVVEKDLRSKMFRLITKLSDRESSSGDELDLESTEGAQDTSSCDEDQKHIHKELVRKYSAISLCSITTEALKVLSATEDLIEEATQEGHSLPHPSAGSLPSEKEAAKLQGQLSKLEENVYMTAGTVYSLEGQLNELEDCARSIHSVTSETKLADLEDQVATAAAQVHQAELQVSDIERRISALNVAGLNVVPCDRLLKKRNLPEAKAETIDSSRQQRRKLPAPPKQGERFDSIGAVSRNGLLQDKEPTQIPDRIEDPAKSAPY